MLAMNLTEFKERLDNNQPLLQDIGEALVQDIRLNFIRESEPDGTPWKPLDPGTLNEKLSLGFPADILRRTGALFKAIDFMLEGDNKVVAGPAIERDDLLIHNFGGKTGPLRPNTIPSRRYVGIGDRAMETIRSLITGYWFGS